MAGGPKWWQRGVVYQIYPRSFQDSDGAGDLRGIIGRLGYLEWLGVDAVWISPFYPSPMVDFGYDIVDHTNVHPLFGTLEDFDHLVAEAHRRGIEVILDYVPNHTSGEHPWFVESRSSRDDPRSTTPSPRCAACSTTVEPQTDVHCGSISPNHVRCIIRR